MNREYIKINKPVSFPDYTNKLRELDDDFWKKWIFFYLLLFYTNFNNQDLVDKIIEEQTKKYPRPERLIAKYIRNYLRNNPAFDLHFDIHGEVTNDEDIEGNYDILITNTYWKNKFYFECKNLNSKQDLVNKYVYSKIYPKNKSPQNDGGVYRFFNGKYAQKQNFGGMLGFVLEGDINEIKAKIIKKLDTKFDVTPEGDLKGILDNSIYENVFTFNSIHNRNENSFIIHHLLFEFIE